MRKVKSQYHAIIVATNAEQTLNIRKHNVIFGDDCIDVSIGRLPCDGVAKKRANALITIYRICIDTFVVEILSGKKTKY